MIDKYSYKILRNDAQKDELDKDDIKRIDHTKFIESWKKTINEISDKKILELNKKTKLIFFLNDKLEKNNSEHISAIYQSFISWQNNFLQPIIDANDKNDGILHFYNHNLKNRIYIQDAKASNILSFQNINLENIINKYSKRNIFNKDGTIDYKNYNSFIYDFESIEKELGEKILSEKCLFYPNLNKYITFWSEENPEILTQFIEKYPQNELLKEEEEKIIIEFLKKKYEFKDYNPKDFFGSFQLMFCYLNHELEIIDNENINEIITKIPKNIKFSKDFIEFFESNNNFKINQLMNIFVYIEHICFVEITKNLNKSFKQTLDQKTKQDILKILNNEEEKLKLSVALRRYISRYLIGNKFIKDIDKNSLHLELKKSDLWVINSKNKNEVEILLNKIAGLNLKVSFSYDLYKTIGKEDEKFLQIFIKKPELENNNEELIDDFDENGDQVDDEDDSEERDNKNKIKNLVKKRNKFGLDLDDEKNEEEQKIKGENKNDKDLIEEYYDKDSENEDIRNDEDDFNLFG
jgi:hypothetical protein